MTGTENAVVALEFFAQEIAKCERALKLDPRIEERCGLVHDLEAEGRAYQI